MIKNDRQYRLSKAQIRLFESAIADLDSQKNPKGMDDRFLEVQRNATQSQLQELNADVQEYEALKSGQIAIFETSSLDDLPLLLVKARIARGVNHKELAERLNVKEQQVQRWESNDFAGASIENLKAIANALGVVFTQKLYIPHKDVTPDKFLRLFEGSGLSSDFILRRIVSPQIASSFRTGRVDLRDVVGAASSISTVFGFGLGDLMELKVPQFNYSAIAATRFKLPSRLNRNDITGYTLYAHYLAATLSQCVENKPRQNLPSNAKDLYQAVTGPDKPMTVERIINFLWDCGIIVLPLSEAGGFHGAVWKINGRFVIVLKQTTSLESRWLFDALHEGGHIRNGDVTEKADLIEKEEISLETHGKEEEAANEWAQDVLFNCQVDEIEEACTKACKHRLQNLKSALPKVAKDFNVNLGSLANHMAFRLEEDTGAKWWGAARNLQTAGRNPFSIAREILLRNVNLSLLSPFDRELILRAISDN